MSVSTEVIKKNLNRCYLAYYSNDSQQDKIDRFAWYYEELQDLDARIIDKAFKSWLNDKDNKKFPRPCDIRNIAFSVIEGNNPEESPAKNDPLDCYIYLVSKGLYEFKKNSNWIIGKVSADNLVKINNKRAQLGRRIYKKFTSEEIEEAHMEGFSKKEREEYRETVEYFKRILNIGTNTPQEKVERLAGGIGNFQNRPDIAEYDDSGPIDPEMERYLQEHCPEDGYA